MKKNKSNIFQLPELKISISLLNPHSWALLVVILISAITGWNREYNNKD